MSSARPLLGALSLQEIRRNQQLHRKDDRNADVEFGLSRFMAKQPHSGIAAYASAQSSHGEQGAFRDAPQVLFYIYFICIILILHQKQYIRLIVPVNIPTPLIPSYVS